MRKQTKYRTVFVSTALLLLFVLVLFLVSCKAQDDTPPTENSTPPVPDLPNDSSPGDSDDSCVCIALYDPVCGVDGKTYSNSCVAGCAGVAVATSGEC